MDSSLVNKVLIIDDHFEEALPIIKALTINGIYSAYWDGQYDTQPLEPLKGVRLVILDMRFSPSYDQRTINTNLYNLLMQAVSQENGPYILCVWSKHGNEYYEEFTKEIGLIPQVPQPYLIINIDKNEFLNITPRGSNEQISSALEGKIDEAVREELLEIFSQNEQYQISYKQGAVEKLFEKLSEEMKKVNSLSILLMWEKMVSKSSNNLVNDIAGLSELGVNWDYNIKNLIRRMAIANAGKSIEESAYSFITNAVASLNHMLPDELWNQVRELTIDEESFSFIKENDVKIVRGSNSYSITKVKKYTVKKDNQVLASFHNLNELMKHDEKEIIETLHKKYVEVLAHTNVKLLCEKSPSIKNKKPGNIYQVDNENILTEMTQCIFDKFSPEEGTVRLVKLDISSSCDYAQNKLKRVRVLYGILMDCDIAKNVQKNEAMYITPELKIEGKLKKIIFSLHHISNESLDEIILNNPFLGFRELLLTDIKHYLTSFISRAGIIQVQ